MKIVHIINSLSSGGAEKLLVDLLPIIKQETNFEVKVFVLSKQADVYSKILEEKGIQVIFSKYNSVKNPLVIFEIMLLFKQYNIVHTHLTQSQVFTAIAKLFSRNKIQLFFTEHSSYGKRYYSKIWYWIDKIVYKQYATLISVSSDVKIKMLNHIGYSFTGKSNVIENGILLECFEKAVTYDRKIYGFTNKDKLLIMISRFNYLKDHKTLIETMKELPEKYKLILLGEGELKTQYQEIVKKLQLENRIFFLGFQSNVASFIKMCDIAILSSFFEGLPLSLVEAMACKKPVIGSHVNGIKEVLSNAGLLFQQGNVEELKKIILSLEDKNFYQKIQSQCFAKSKQYDIHQTAQKYINLYLSIQKPNN